MSTARHYSAWLLWLLFFPSDAMPQRPAVEALRALPLDSLSGTVAVYYSPGYADRARELQTSYDAAVAHYQDMFAGQPSLDLSTSLALLAPHHWSAVTARPYGAPHIDFSEWPDLLVVLPATSDEGFVAELWRNAGLTSQLDVERSVDVIGFHEFGHALNVRYLYALASGTEIISVQWFDELMATYFGQGFLWHTEGFDADPLGPELLTNIAPRYRTLAEFEEHHPQYFRSAEGYANYGWYQLQFALRSREVFRRQGLDFIRRVRDELPWDRYATWRTDELLAWLEKIEPGFVAWADALDP